ncbi:hypothetical protein [Aquitalea sp.]|uniref:hypothetical protein n=1 Tax=Aquitalea sp. TaxID=1872623 RepID=UPI00258714D3|nr:hypothetical protein [Aquitalea sp.]
MSATDVQFIQGVISEVQRSDRNFSREVLASCYYEDLKLRGIVELAAVSEMWIDLYWERLSKISFDQLAQTAKSTPKLTKLLIELFGK